MVLDHHDWDIGRIKVYTMLNCLQFIACGMLGLDVFEICSIQLLISRQHNPYGYKSLKCYQ